MFAHNRKTKTLEEDLKSLGLISNGICVEEYLFGKPAQASLSDEGQGEAGSSAVGLAEESVGEELSEALKRVRMKRMSASARAKARRGYRKNRMKIARILKKKRKKPAYKRRKKKLVKLKGKKTAGRRAKFILASDDAVATVVESLEKFEVDAMTAQEMIEAFGLVSILAKSIHEAYDDLDDEELDDEELDNDDLEDLDDDDLDDDLDDDEDLNDDESEELDDEELDDDELDDFDDVNELENLIHDSSRVAAEVKDGAITPKESASALKDMVSYLTGALKAFQKLNVLTGKHVYVGKHGLLTTKEKPEIEKVPESSRMGKEAYGHKKEIVPVLEGEDPALLQAKELPYRMYLNLTRKKNPGDIEHFQKKFIEFIQKKPGVYQNWIKAWQEFSREMGQKMDRFGHWIV